MLCFPVEKIVKVCFVGGAVRNEQICNRSVFTKTDQLQTTLSSAESVFSLLQTLSLNTLRDVKTADAKQTNNRSADLIAAAFEDDLQHVEDSNPILSVKLCSSFVIRYVSDPSCYSIREDFN